MPERLWMLLLVIVVVISIAVFIQDKSQWLEEERSTYCEQMEKVAIEASQLKQVKRETDREARISSAKLTAPEENRENLEDERTASDDEKGRLVIPENDLKQQHDDFKSQLINEGIWIVLKNRGHSGLVLVNQFKTQAALKENKLIDGIAMINEDIFALTSGSNIIEHFDSTTLSTKRTLVLQGRETLEDLQPCNQSQSLFVIEKEFTGRKFILSVDPYNNNIVDSWAVDSCIKRLSVTEDCHVLATCPNKNKIIEYSSTGHLIQEIVLKPEMGFERPRLALKMTNGNFLVSFDGNALWAGVGIAILNSSGVVLKSYSDPSGNPVLVNAMAIDSLGNILVAEMSNGRVSLLSSDLEYKTELMSRENGIGIINALLLDEVNGRLFVADYDFNVQGVCFGNARIMVFDL